MATLMALVDAQIKNTTNDQNRIYENIVGKAIDENQSPDEIAAAYQKYHQQINHFDVNAFHETLSVMQHDVKQNDPERYATFAANFKSIPAYINERNNFNDKRKELLRRDGSNSDKQAMFDALDRRRTRAHNGVISLFNQMNELAQEHNLPEPYPNDGVPYNKHDPEDREKVAGILENHEPLLETVNDFVLRARISAGLADPTANLKKMNLIALYHYAEKHQAKDRNAQPAPKAPIKPTVKNDSQDFEL